MVLCVRKRPGKEGEDVLKAAGDKGVEGGGDPDYDQEGDAGGWDRPTA